MDFAYANVSGELANYKGKTVTQLGYTATTSAINVEAMEDLGGGLKAQARYELDPRALASDGGALGRHQAFIALSGGFGTVRLGAPNSLGLRAFLATSPLGTGIGSGYAPGGNNTGATNLVTTRWSRSMQYTSPTVSGFSASATFAPGVDETVAPANNASANGIPLGRAATELGLNYSNGPLNLVYVNIQNGEFKNGATNGATATANSQKTTANVFGANYTMGAATLYAAYMDGDLKMATGSVATAPVEIKGYRLAAKYNMGTVDLIGSYQQAEIQSGAAKGMKDKITGLRADYNLSKRTAVYAGFENWNGTAATADTRKVTSIGVRHSF